MSHQSVVIALTPSVSNYVLVCTSVVMADSNHEHFLGLCVSFDGGETYATDYMVNNNTSPLLHIASNSDSTVFHGHVYLYNTASGHGNISTVGGSSVRVALQMYNEGSSPSMCMTQGVATHIAVRSSNGAPFSGTFTLRPL
jgi:hypothetical protein